MKNIKCTVFYLGTSYFGWQKTKAGPSIEETLENCLKQILQEKIHLQAASRTDRGVHAKEQIINFFTSKTISLNLLMKSMNRMLPKDIAVKELAQASPHFHPTLDCTAKEYGYWICNGSYQLPFHQSTSWHHIPLLSLEKMKEAALYFIGTHDFSAFCNLPIKNPNDAIRTIHEISIEEEENRISIRIKGSFFLYKMVRNIVGTLVFAGSGKISPDSIPSILRSRKRSQAKITAPAHGLFLTKVFYENSHEITPHVDLKNDYKK
ncbi:MAG: tRNA pseudouridine(38-40) synthase TruA [Chlamydiae bacterium]|nr:tRNA pseudouridine(38-40) synthase TruA [Chlamydiota bacterium]